MIEKSFTMLKSVKYDLSVTSVTYSQFVDQTPADVRMLFVNQDVKVYVARTGNHPNGLFNDLKLYKNLFDMDYELVDNTAILSLQDYFTMNILESFTKSRIPQHILKEFRLILNNDIEEVYSAKITR